MLFLDRLILAQYDTHFTWSTRITSVSRLASLRRYSFTTWGWLWSTTLKLESKSSFSLDSSSLNAYIRDSVRLTQSLYTCSASGEYAISLIQVFSFFTRLANMKLNATSSASLQALPAADKINNFNRGDSSASLLRNTAGYNVNRRNNRTRDNFTFKTDYNLSPRNSITVTNLWNRDILDRPDVEVLATVSRPGAEGTIVAVRQGSLLATAFHPELTGDRRIHELFVKMVRDQA